MTGRLMLLDTASLYFRAFYGVPDRFESPDGRPVNAVRGLLDMIAKLVAAYEPTHLIACWDDDWRPQWRVDLIPSYKAHRVVEPHDAGPDAEEVPDRLEVQVPVIREALGVLGIRIAGCAEHEADDVIGTLATVSDLPTDVVTGDRDLFQLVDDARGVRVIYTGRGMSNLDDVTAGTIAERYGIGPAQYADFAVLRGDASDGLPGVAGVGEKTAATLLTTHENLAGILRAAEAGAGMSAGVRAKILAAADYLAVAPRVVEVVRDLDVSPEPSRISAPDDAAVAALAARWSLGDRAARAAAALAARA
ncbi:5'-3' exonuclease [Microbacterium sp. No. 7]|uniref:5'-3' exonuclease n=1 Tax=Microbacterium sp. No. 7 TaxID=1714373 RepID=UPI0006D2A63C|nr:5'-3' exonuclease [Microbacterium sp. No. 7]ALJ20776.1 5'-3' exonuclease [Microbacterium sp. No. 7]